MSQESKPRKPSHPSLAQAWNNYTQAFHDWKQSNEESLKELEELRQEQALRDNSTEETNQDNANIPRPF
jgi:hypothetical protein